MRFFRDAANPQRSPKTTRALAALFPELARIGGVRLAEALLRAPPYGRRVPPVLSGWADDAHGHAAIPTQIQTTGRVLAARGWEAPALLARAAAARRTLVAARVGGGWWHRGGAAVRGAVLVAIGETPMPGGGLAGGDGVSGAMLDRAFAENPGERVVVIAPQRVDKGIRARLAAAAARGAAIVGPDCDPWALLDGAARVYSNGGETGFLALLSGVPVTTLSASFYTGWGVTEDAAAVLRRAFARSVDEIFAGACLVAMRCRDPFEGGAATFEDLVAMLGDWRRLEETNRGIAVCIGMSFWKRRRVAEFVRSSQGVPRFRRSVGGALAAVRRAAGPPGAIAGWASRLPEGLDAAAAQQGVPLIRVEDGFIRSVGLGSDFLPPASLVFDRTGMYYDPRRGSDLECLLRERHFDPALVARAERLAAQLVARGVTKYNIAGGAPVEVPSGRRCILVPGQVEDDLSIRFGAGAVRRNLDLLREVRVANPDAFILYKPHPDVVAGHRVGAVPEATARRFADVVVADGATAPLLALADELHTMTSLAGFEALLRGRRVVVYGRPFYAGWGLTIDLPPFDRGRRLSLAELVAATLILYPRYLDPLTGLPCGPETMIERLDRPELWRAGPLVLARRLQGMLARRLVEARAMLPSAGPAPARGLRERPRP
jgi:capsular polysaccharide export protein